MRAGKFAYLRRMKYHKATTTFDVETTFFRETEKYNFTLDLKKQVLEQHESIYVKLSTCICFLEMSRRVLTKT